MFSRGLTDSGEWVLDLDAELAEEIGSADAGELKELRAADGPRAQDHFPTGSNALHRATGSAAHVFDPGGPFPFQEDAGGVGAGHDR